MSTFIEIGGVTRKPLVDLTWNDPMVNIYFFDINVYHYVIQHPSIHVPEYNDMYDIIQVST